ncbi:hypothetical protein LWI29_018344 [Acer saccharum]|uniref:Leucine-rich repeat-containing N-terminal plant-type domain-containing protein n=1 Tax=Acer saccharum TaxID=4024 RepID=A0AA39TF20_ACESA|nr:hypothetical protein LWI29_018344 [Acer saccharum]
MASASIEEANALLNWKATFANQTQSQLPSWDLLSHKPSTTSPCTWFGISCNSAGNVIKINITSFGLNGTLQEFSFSSFPNLKYVDLAINSLYGNIPSQIAFLSKLIYLDLSTNHLSGQIPPEIGLLTNLQFLHLVENQLNGSIPLELGNLKSLVSLRFSSNNLSGSIPPLFGGLRNLTLLYLRKNQLSGLIPEKLGNLISLTCLDLSKNQLSGGIPSEFGLLTNLKHLVLSEDVERQAEVRSAHKLFVSCNAFNGMFEALTKLQKIDMMLVSLPDIYPQIEKEIEEQSREDDRTMLESSRALLEPVWMYHVYETERFSMMEEEMESL